MHTLLTHKKQQRWLRPAALACILLCCVTGSALWLLLRIGVMPGTIALPFSARHTAEQQGIDPTMLFADPTSYDTRPCVAHPSTTTCNGRYPESPPHVDPQFGAQHGAGACIDGATKTVEHQVITDGSGHFQNNTGTFTGIANWFNRRNISSGVGVNASTSSTSAVQLGGNLTYFQWGDELLAFMTFLGTVSLTNTNGFTAEVGFGTTGYAAIGPSQPSANVPIDSSFSFYSAGAAIEGFLNLNLIGQVGGGTGSWLGTVQAVSRC